MWFGVILIVIGLAAAVTLWDLGGQRRSDAVAGFARAPVGCDTTLDFAEAGEYFVYVETAGRLDQIGGDCDVAGAYDVRPQQPDPVVTVVDPDGEPVPLEPAATEVDYDADGFVGSARFRLDIARASDHVIRVESPDDAVYAVAIGPDPTDGVAALRVGAIAAGLGATLLGLALVLWGARRTNQADASPTWAPTPSGPPGSFVPGRPPQGPPVHAQPQGPPQWGPVSPSRPVPPPPGPAPTGPPGRTGSVPPPPPPGAQPPSVPHSGPPRIPGQPPLGPTPTPTDPPTRAGERRADEAAPEDRWAPLPPPE